MRDGRRHRPELLLDALVEPDVDGDGLGDESQDPDGGGLGLDWEDDWFDDFEAGDELDEDFTQDPRPRHVRRQLRRLQGASRLTGAATPRCCSSVPKAGMVSATVTLPANRRTGAGPFTTILTGDKRVRHAGRVRLRLDPTGGRRRAPAQAAAAEDQGGRGVLPAQGAAHAADALRTAVVDQPNDR